MTGLLLRGARVVTPHGVIADGEVHVADGRITAVGGAGGFGGAVPGGTESRDLDGAWLLPGFIDLHSHGGGGHDVTTSAEDMAAAAAFHLGHGTTGTLVSLVTAPLAELRRQLDWVAALTGRPPGELPRVWGAHLEGPFLSVDRCGAQNTAHMLAPDRAVFADLLAAAQGTLRCITVAPELPGALAVVADAVAAGVVAALGHSDATYAQARAAIDTGASLATHLFNGMRPVHHREPGLVGAALAAGIRCEVIDDGVHVHPAIVDLVAARPDRLVLVTDAIALAGAGDGEFALGGQPVVVREGQARLRSTGSLAGSTLTMDRAVRAAVEGGLPIEIASAAASGTPARVLGVADRVGAIAPGMLADLVVLDDDLTVREVYLAGRRRQAVSRSEH